MTGGPTRGYVDINNTSTTYTKGASEKQIALGDLRRGHEALTKNCATFEQLYQSIDEQALCEPQTLKRIDKHITVLKVALKGIKRAIKQERAHREREVGSCEPSSSSD